jgi:hypothetical protein
MAGSLQVWVALGGSLAGETPGRPGQYANEPRRGSRPQVASRSLARKGLKAMLFPQTGAVWRPVSKGAAAAERA